MNNPDIDTYEFEAMSKPFRNLMCGAPLNAQPICPPSQAPPTCAPTPRFRWRMSPSLTSRARFSRSHEAAAELGLHSQSIEGEPEKHVLVSKARPWRPRRRTGSSSRCPQQV